MGGGKFGGLVPRKFDVLQGGKVFYVVGRVDFFAVQNVFGVEKLFYRTHYPEFRLRMLQRHIFRLQKAAPPSSTAFFIAESIASTARARAVESSESYIKWMW